MSEAIVAQRGPFAPLLQTGWKAASGACGRSARQPFGDGSHDRR